MKLDLSCPLELTEWELLRDDRAHARAYLKLRCVADAPVTAFEGVVRWIDAESGDAKDTPFQADEMSLQPRTLATIPLSAGYLPRSVRLEAFFTAVRLENGDEWTCDESTPRVYPDPPKLIARLSNALAAEAGDDAICCAEEREDGGWLCVCGRPNPSGKETCARCGRDREETLRLYSPVEVERLANERVGVFQKYYEPFGAETVPAEAPPAKKTGGRLRAILTCLLLATLLAFAALGVRTLRYAASSAAGLMPTSNLPQKTTLAKNP